MIRTRPVLLLLIIIMALARTQHLQDDCFVPNIENGKVGGSFSSDGKTYVATVSCRPGFDLIGKELIKCRNGIWSADFPVCILIGGCKTRDPPGVEFGERVAVHPYRGSVFRYKCKHGFKLFGAHTVHCQGSDWSIREAPICAKKGCDESHVSEDFPHGTVKKYLKGAIVMYECNEGRILQGSRTLFCNGQRWNGTKPSCIHDHRPPARPHISGIFPGERLNGGESRSLSCTSEAGHPAAKLFWYLDDEPLQSSRFESASYNKVTSDAVLKVAIDAEPGRRVLRCEVVVNDASVFQEIDFVVDAPQAAPFSHNLEEEEAEEEEEEALRGHQKRTQDQLLIEDTNTVTDFFQPPEESSASLPAAEIHQPDSEPDDEEQSLHFSGTDDEAEDDNLQHDEDVFLSGDDFYETYNYNEDPQSVGQDEVNISFIHPELIFSNVFQADVSGEINYDEEGKYAAKEKWPLDDMEYLLNVSANFGTSRLQLAALIIIFVMKDLLATSWWLSSSS